MCSTIDSATGKWIVFGWCVVAALLCSCSGAPPDTPLTNDPPGTTNQLLVKEWLLRDCTFGSDGELASAIQEKGDTLYEAFKKAYTDGPDSAITAEWSKGAEDHYDAVQTLFAATDTQRISPRVRQQFLSATKDAYRNRIVAGCVASWRSNALLGVGLTHADGALPFINAAFADPKSDSALRHVAALAAQVYADTSGLLIR